MHSGFAQLPAQPRAKTTCLGWHLHNTLKPGTGSRPRPQRAAHTCAHIQTHTPPPRPPSHPASYLVRGAGALVQLPQVRDRAGQRLGCWRSTLRGWLCLLLRVLLRLPLLHGCHARRRHVRRRWRCRSRCARHAVTASPWGRLVLSGLLRTPLKPGRGRHAP